MQVDRVKINKNLKLMQSFGYRRMATNDSREISLIIAIY